MQDRWVPQIVAWQHLSSPFKQNTSRIAMKLHIDVELGPDEVGLATELLNTLRSVR